MRVYVRIDKSVYLKYLYFQYYGVSNVRYRLFQTHGELHDFYVFLNLFQEKCVLFFDASRGNIWQVTDVDCTFDSTEVKSHNMYTT